MSVRRVLVLDAARCAARDWALTIIGAAGPDVPVFGEPGWARETDPTRRLAGVAAAAWAWLAEAHPVLIEDRTRAHLARVRELELEALQVAWRRMRHDDMRTHAELEQARRLPDPSPSDYQGGPVPWLPAERGAA